MNPRPTILERVVFSVNCPIMTLSEMNTAAKPISLYTNSEINRRFYIKNRFKESGSTFPLPGSRRYQMGLSTPIQILKVQGVGPVEIFEDLVASFIYVFVLRIGRVYMIGFDKLPG